MTDTQLPTCAQRMLHVTKQFWNMPFNVACQLAQAVSERDEVYFSDNQVLGLSPLPARLAANATSAHSALTN
jgi:hypothetical protein